MRGGEDGGREEGGLWLGEGEVFGRVFPFW